MLIEYWIEYPRSYGCFCCGQFRDLDHFKVFKRVEASYGRMVSRERVL